MFRLRGIATLAGLCTLLSGSPAIAWDGPGHMAIAGLAYDQLSASEKSKLATVMTAFSDKQRLVDDLNTPSPSPRDLVMAGATWPDLIKQDPGFTGRHDYDEPGPLIKVEESKVMHVGWHFIDTPFHSETGVDGPPLDGSKVNIVEVLSVLDAQLKSHESAAERAYDTIWLLHLVGDIHQPLHCASNFDTNNPTGDVGGNNVTVTDDISGAKELHGYWDDILGKPAPRDRITKKLRLDRDVVRANSIIAAIGTQTLPADADTIDFAAWAKHSHALAVNDVYKQIDLTTILVHKDGDDMPADSATLDENYHNLATDDAQQQVYLAGHRLALLLKKYLAAM